MSTHREQPHRPFLDAAEAETAADPGALKNALSESVHDAKVLGLPEVKQHVEAALDAVPVHAGADGPPAPEAKSIGQHEPEAT